MIVFLSCVKTKQKTRCAAQDMYTSDLFKKSLAYAKKLQPDRIFILSAKYGLLELHDTIDPYNATLIGASNEACKKWAYMVYKQMQEKHVDFDEKAVFLCGKNYRKYLITKFPNAAAPLKHLGIGQQLAFYAKELKEE